MMCIFNVLYTRRTLYPVYEIYIYIYINMFVGVVKWRLTKQCHYLDNRVIAVQYDIIAVLR